MTKPSLSKTPLAFAMPPSDECCVWFGAVSSLDLEFDLDIQYMHTLLYPYQPFAVERLRECLRRRVGRTYAAKLNASIDELIDSAQPEDHPL